MSDSTAKGKVAKPAKPHPDFPLTVHPCGQWSKKIRGKVHYFGSWKADPTGKVALLLWLDVKDDLLAGRAPRPTGDGLTVANLCNHFLADKKHQQEAGDIGARTFDDYQDTCKIIVEKFGRNSLVTSLTANDFRSIRADLAKRYGVARLGNTVTRIRTVFNYGYQADLLDVPVKFGPTFKKPPRKKERQHKQQSEKKFFEADQIRQLIEAATQPLKAMILLAVNCGMGNNDCGKMPLSAIDLDRGWLDYPRPKTAVARRCPLWPETVDAIREAIAQRPAAKLPENDGLAFLTKYGQPWAKDTPDSPVTKEFRKLLNSHKLHRRGVGFYALRHVFETIAAECCDQKAVDAIMGHDDGATSNRYVEGISDARLLKASDTVHRWLFREVS